MTRNRHSPHVTLAELADHADGRTVASARARIEAHLAACPTCAGRLASITEITQLMRTDRSPEPPVYVVSRAVRLFQPETLPEAARRWLAGAAEVIGRLVFDSRQQPSFATARGVMSGRRLRFEAGGLELDLVAERHQGKGYLTGQVSRMEAEARPVAGAHFLAIAAGRPPVEGTTDALGEFNIVVEHLDGVWLVIREGEQAVTFLLPTDLDG